MRWVNPSDIVAEDELKKFRPITPRVPVGIISSGCPRCRGTLIQEPDESGKPELTCVNCARTFQPEIILK
jgi:exosome complex RNA-binding protein Csl4